MSQRIDRVQELARRVLGELIQDLKDPRIGFATVTGVKVTPDLRQAKVAVSVLGTDEERSGTIAGLTSASSRLRAELGQQLKMKYTPHLTFELDDTQDRAERIEGLLKKLHDEEEQVNDSWSEIASVLLEADEVTIACHVNPDGDALGSLLALTLSLRKSGKTVHATWGASPAAVPPSYRFLPGVGTIEEYPGLSDPDVFVAVDCGGADRLGDVEPLARRARVLINIDHHPGNERFGHLNVVETSASSTAELVAHLLREMQVELDRDIAICLYTGVVTDTGRFQYSNSTPETLRLAADLLELEVPAPKIALEVFESAPFGYLKLLGRVLERAELAVDERFVFSWITQADLEETEVAMDETEKLIDLLRGTRDAVVAAMFKEQPDGTYRVSMRSKGPVKVNAIAQKRGGGGHDLAAGFTAPDLHPTAAQIRAEVGSRWTE